MPQVTLQATMHETADLILPHLKGGHEVRIMFNEPFVERGEYCESQVFTAAFSDPAGLGLREVTRQLRAFYRAHGWRYPGAVYRNALKQRP